LRLVQQVIVIFSEETLVSGVSVYSALVRGIVSQLSVFSRYGCSDDGRSVTSRVDPVDELAEGGVYSLDETR